MITETNLQILDALRQSLDVVLIALDAANALQRRGDTGEALPLGAIKGAAVPGPHRLIRLEGGHGFMCEARADHRPAAAALGWRAMLAWFSANL